MPSYFDLGLIVIVLTSALLSMVRGFTREVLAIVSWASAAVAAIGLNKFLTPYLKPYIQNEKVAFAVSIVIIFLLVLVIVTVLTVKISDVILDSRVGAIDRSLGFIFGAARGYLLAVIAFMFFIFLVPDKSQPEWMKTAKTKVYLEESRKQLSALLPSVPPAFWDSIRGKKTGTDEAPSETSSEQPGAPAAATPAQTDAPTPPRI